MRPELAIPAPLNEAASLDIQSGIEILCPVIVRHLDALWGRGLESWPLRRRRLRVAGSGLFRSLLGQGLQRPAVSFPSRCMHAASR